MPRLDLGGGLSPGRNIMLLDKVVQRLRIPHVGHRMNGKPRQELKVPTILCVEVIIGPNRLDMLEISDRRIPLVDAGFHIVKGRRIGGEHHDRGGRGETIGGGQGPHDFHDEIVFLIR